MKQGPTEERRAGVSSALKPDAAEVLLDGLPPTPPGTSWVDPDPPPIPDRILRKVEPEKSTTWGRMLNEATRHWRRRYRRRHGVYFVAVVTAVVMAVLLWPGQNFTDADAARWQRLCTAYSTWFEPFMHRLTPDDRMALREASLEPVLTEVDNARKSYDPLLIAGIPASTLRDDQQRAFLLQLANQPTSLARRPEGVTATFNAMAGLDRVVNTFERWDAAVELRQLLPQLESHGWTGPAREAREALAQLPPKSSSPVASSVRRIAMAHSLASQAIAASSGLNHQLDALKTSDDPVIQAFCATVQGLGQDPRFHEGTAEPSAQMEILVAQLKPLEAFGQRLAAALHDGTWAKVDHALYASQGKAYAMLATQHGQVTDDLLRAWLEEMPRFYKVADDWREAWAATQRGKLRDIEDRLALLRAAQHPSAKPMGARWHKLDERIALLIEPPLVAGVSAAMDIDRQDIEGELRDLDAAVKQVLGQVNTPTPAN